MGATMPDPGSLSFRRHHARLTLMGASARTPAAERGFLDGQFLIAMPGMEDSRFARAVIYLCAHSPDGAMGIMVNQAASQISFRELLVQLGVIPEEPAILLPPPVRQMRVHHGGPVETGRGFVLHSADYFLDNSTLPIDEHVCLTATLDILKAIANGSGPESAMLALGYAGWGPGQLETEIQHNGWLHCPATPDLLFDPRLEEKYERALAAMGISPVLLSSDAGHA
jgi:putative transcriptional regulator